MKCFRHCCPNDCSGGDTLGRCRSSCRSWTWRSVLPQTIMPLAPRHTQSALPAMERRAPAMRRCALRTGGLTRTGMLQSKRISCTQISMHVPNFPRGVNRHLKCILRTFKFVTRQQRARLCHGQLSGWGMIRAVRLRRRRAGGRRRALPPSRLRNWSGRLSTQLGQLKDQVGAQLRPGADTVSTQFMGMFQRGQGQGRSLAVAARLACCWPANSAAFGGR